MNGASSNGTNRHSWTAGQLVGDLEVPQHLEVLDGDRMAVVVVRDDLGLHAQRLALPGRLHDRRPLAPHRARRLHRAVARLV